MEYVIGILLLVSFFGLVVYAVRGGNLMLGIFVMGIIWTVLPMIGNMFVTKSGFYSRQIKMRSVLAGQMHFRRYSRAVLKDGDLYW